MLRVTPFPHHGITSLPKADHLPLSPPCAVSLSLSSLASALHFGIAETSKASPSMSPSYHSRTQTHLVQACVQCEQEATNGCKVSSPSTLNMHAFQGPPGSFLRKTPTDSECQALRQAQYIQLHFLLHMKYSMKRTQLGDAKKILFLPCFSLYILQAST